MILRALALALALALVASPIFAEETIAAVQVNGKTVETAAVLNPTPDGDLAMDVATWANWGVVIPGPMAAGAMISAKALGIEIAFDEASQTYRLTVPAALLPAQRFQPGQTWSADTNAQPVGVFTNYDLAVNRNPMGDWLSSFAHDSRMGLFGGTLVSTGQVNHATDGFQYRRGLTTWNKDFVAQGTTFQLGDVFTRQNNLARSVNLGGVHWGTDRGLRPGELFYPVPVVGGIADTRSTAELYVDAVKQQQQKLQAGPYQIQPGGLRMGANNVEVVLRDEFGREQVVSQDFYLSSQNLQKGKTEWGVDAGWVRTSPISDAYGAPAVAGYVNHGVSDNWTTGGQVQITKDAQNLAWANRFSSDWGALSLDMSASRSGQGTGNAWGVGYSYQNQEWNVFANHQQRSRDYWDLSQDATTALANSLHVDRSTSVGVGYTPRNFNRLQVAAAINQVFMNNGDESNRLSASAHYTSGANSFGASLSYDLNKHTPGVYVSYRRALGNSASISASASQNESGNLTEAVQVSGRSSIGNHPVQYNGGVANTPMGKTGFANAQGLTSVGEWSVNTTAQGGDLQAGGRFGGALWVGEGGVLAAPKSYGSFALVEVPDQKGVGVASNGGFSQTTNAKGYALVSDLQPLRKNHIRIDPSQLPLDTSFDTTTQTIVAGRKGGAKVVFPVSTSRLVEVHLHHNGKLLDAPGTVTTTTDEVPLGEGGVAVLEQPSAGQVLTVTKPGMTCKAVLPADLPDFTHPLELECL